MAKNDGIYISRKLLKSSAFRSLNSTAKTVLLDFYMMKKVAKVGSKNSKRSPDWIQTNNGELQYCYTTALNKGIPRQTFVRAIDQLIERGFIEIAHQGNGGRKGDKSLYALINNWEKWGTVEFTCKTRKKNMKAGIGFRVIHERMGTSKTNTSNVTGT